MKPPASPPSSDLEGACRDRRDVVDAALAADQDAGDLDKARQNSPGRPPADEAGPGRDDRTR